MIDIIKPKEDKVLYAQLELELFKLNLSNETEL